MDNRRVQCTCQRLAFDIRGSQCVELCSRVEKAQPMSNFMIGEVTFGKSFWILFKRWTDTPRKRVRLYNDTILQEII